MTDQFEEEDNSSNEDNWGFYTTSINEKFATVLFNESLVDRLIDEKLPTMFSVTVTITTPSEDGMPSNEEADVLTEIESALESALNIEDMYLGRLTSGGLRQFFFYSQLPPENFKLRIAPVETKHGYVLRLESQDDPHHRFYFEWLYPSPETRQWMNDCALYNQLQKSGDTLSKPRRIDHWAYFPGEAKPFIEWALEKGFQIETVETGELEPGVVCVQLFHIAAPDPDTFSATTIEIFRAAAANGGTYDGWETSVQSEGGNGGGA